jgi:hypothetical protein
MQAQIILILLTAITALIHFQRVIADPDIRILFILNSLGYFALLAACYLPAFQRFHSLCAGRLSFMPRSPFCFTSCGVL